MKIHYPAIFFILYFSWLPEGVCIEPSAYVNVTTLLKTETSWDGTPIQLPSGKTEVTCLLIEVAPGGETGWHLHPVPSFAMILEGEIEVRLENGVIKSLKPGEALAEVVNTFHNGRNAGSVPVKIVVFYISTVGESLSIPKTKN
jgi:quercetin dioxygenase-like cupin family protein